MRSGQPVISRPAWYDRNPTQQLKSYHNYNVAPHAEVARWTYTVPSGKKAFLESALVHLTRVSAATTAARARAMIRITPSGGSALVLLDAEVLTNNIGDSAYQVVGFVGILLEGDKVEGRTGDDSTGGTFDYDVTCKIIEFDA